MIKPIRPEYVVIAKQGSIPDEVIEAFNELIAERWNGHCSSFTQKEVVDEIMKKISC